MLTVIAIKVGLVDHCVRGIRWTKIMTRALLDLYGADRGGEVCFRDRRGVVPRLQIRNGITSFPVTASRGGVIAIDIG